MLPRSVLRSGKEVEWRTLIINGEELREAGHVETVFRIGFAWFSCQHVFFSICSLCERWVNLLLILSLLSKGSGAWLPKHWQEGYLSVAWLLGVYLVYVIVCKGLEWVWETPEVRTILQSLHGSCRSRSIRKKYTGLVLSSCCPIWPVLKPILSWQPKDT